MTTARKKKHKVAPELVVPGQASTFVAYLLKQFVEGKGYKDDAGAVRRLLDAELGDRTLTEELYKMRGKSL